MLIKYVDMGGKSRSIKTSSGRLAVSTQKSQNTGAEDPEVCTVHPGARLQFKLNGNRNKETLINALIPTNKTYSSKNFNKNKDEENATTKMSQISITR